MRCLTSVSMLLVLSLLGTGALVQAQEQASSLPPAAQQLQGQQAPVPQQRYQAQQQYLSAPQMSAPRFSLGGNFGGGGTFSGRQGSNGGGGRRR